MGFDEMNIYIRLKEKPALFFGRKSLLSLRDTLTGMLLGIQYSVDPSGLPEEEHLPLLKGFIDWYHQTYVQDTNGYACWWNHILYTCGNDDSMAFDRFWERFEEYLVTVKHFLPDPAKIFDGQYDFRCFEKKSLDYRLQSGDILIRDLRPEDIGIIVQAETEQGWHPSAAQYESRIRDQNEGKCIPLIAQYRENVAGYVNLYKHVSTGPFGGMGLPEIVDLGLFEKFRRKGIGSLLMYVVESIAATYADRVSLAVGMHSGYGSAQRMYIKRGYIPDGSGVWYKGKQLEQYVPCMNDDDLVIFMSKHLNRFETPPSFDSCEKG